jgi:segregation and condensation protein B
MNDSYVRNVIEAALLAAGGPLPVAELMRLFDDSLRPSTQELRAALAALEAEYAGRGIELKETASGFRIQVRRELAAEISRLWPERPARYSRALLETLALIAYRQPITRAEIEAVRGVAVNPNIIRTMIERNWVRVVGHRDVAGHPELLGTTRDFLDYFGLKNLDELPPLAELKAMGDINLQLALAAEGARADSAASEGTAAGGTAGGGTAADGGVAATSGTAAESADDAASGPDDACDEDELSADGGSSAELVAAPPDRDG